MTIHNLKIERQWADAKLTGEKTFEVRYNLDRGFQKGDEVHYTVVDPKTSQPWRSEDGRPHPLEQAVFEILYVLAGVEGIEHGYCAFADGPRQSTRKGAK